MPQERTYTSEDYWNLPDGQRAELIDGKLYPMPMTNRIHQQLIGELLFTIGKYIDSHAPSCEVLLSPFAVNLTRDNMTWVEPDLTIICDKSILSERACEGTPDWIIEIILPDNPEHDYIRKLNLYKDAGVREYWIVDPRHDRIFVYFFDQDDFKVDVYTFQDKIKVNIYEDFWIDFRELNL